jgi:hypothetical protein
VLVLNDDDNDDDGHADAWPVLEQDEVDVEGYHTCVGTAFLGAQRAERDSEVVRRLKAAGCVLLAKLNMHEIGAVVDDKCCVDVLNECGRGRCVWIERGCWSRAEPVQYSPRHRREQLWLCGSGE